MRYLIRVNEAVYTFRSNEKRTAFIILALSGIKYRTFEITM